MHRRIFLAAPLALPFLARRAAAQGAPMPVVASFSILGDMVRQVGGERVAVRVLAGPDADAHAFQPRPADAAAVRDARLVVSNGLGFEPWLDRLLRSAGQRGTVAVASAGIRPGQHPNRHAFPADLPHHVPQDGEGRHHRHRRILRGGTAGQERQGQGGGEEEATAHGKIPVCYRIT